MLNQPFSPSLPFIVFSETLQTNIKPLKLSYHFQSRVTCWESKYIFPEKMQNEFQFLTDGFGP